MMVGLYWQQLSAFADATLAAGGSLTGPGSPASTLCSFPLPSQSLGHLFLIEWFVDAYIVSAIAESAASCFMLTLCLRAFSSGHAWILRIRL